MGGRRRELSDSLAGTERSWGIDSSEGHCGCQLKWELSVGVGVSVSVGVNGYQVRESCYVVWGERMVWYGVCMVKGFGKGRVEVEEKMGSPRIPAAGRLFYVRKT